MTEVLRFSDPAKYGDRTIIPLIRDNTLVSDYGSVGYRDPVGLVIIEQGEAWLVSLAEEISLRTIDEMLGIND
jgi:hypothetical protein